MFDFRIAASIAIIGLVLSELLVGSALQTGGRI